MSRRNSAESIQDVEESIEMEEGKEVVTIPTPMDIETETEGVRVPMESPSHSLGRFHLWWLY